MRPVKFAPKLTPLRKQGKFCTYGDAETAVQIMYDPTVKVQTGRIDLRFYDESISLSRKAALELAEGLVKAACCYTEDAK